MITFRFAGTDGTMVEEEQLTSGMVKKKVKLEFSNDWDNRTKMAVFTAGSVSRDVVCVSDVVEIPAEVLAKPLERLYVGAYGVSDDGEVTPTIRVMGPEIAPGVNPSGDQSTTQSLPVWAQLQAMIGDLKNLDTEAKENLVAAINEAAKTGNDNTNADLTGYATEQWVQDGYQPKGNYLTEHQDISGKLDADKLPEVVNDALAQAKASGEFDGAKGEKGDTGAQGDPGKTPVRGTDYWTAADQEDIVQQVIDALGGTPVFGMVDANNNIILTGALAEGTYTLKYEDADGNVTVIGTLNHTNVPEPTYTNLFVPGTASLNTRMSGSAKTPKTENGYVMTALMHIPATSVPTSGSATEKYIAVPASMWTKSANMFMAYDETNVTNGYVDAGTTKGTVVGNWAKIPLVNQYAEAFICRGVTLSLYVKGSALTESDIQNIEIYFNEIPE